MDSSTAFHELKQSLSQSIIGQSHLVDRLLIALLADGHLGGILIGGLLQALGEVDAQTQ